MKHINDESLDDFLIVSIDNKKINVELYFMHTQVTSEYLIGKQSVGECQAQRDKSLSYLI